jgi:hypothetical protein
MDMEWMRSRNVLALFTLIFASLMLLVLLPSLPSLSPPGRDSAVFLYLGSRFVEGEIPYRDIWDHKGPVIYFIDALGYLIGGGSSWGVWLLQYVTLTATALIGFFALRRLFDTASALVASIIWIATLPAVLDQGNFTETWALPMQFGALLLLALLPAAWATKNKRRIALLAFGIGILGALAFFLRPNLISIWLAMGAVLFLRTTSRQRAVSHIQLVVPALTGGAVVAFFFIAFFSANGALSQLWDSMIVYNLSYSASDSLENRVTSTLGLLTTVGKSGSGIVILSGFGLLLALGAFVVKTADNVTSVKVPMIAQIAVIAFPLEMLISSGVSGRNYSHYAQTWLPSLAVLSAYAVFLVLRNINFRSEPNRIISVQTSIVGLIIVSIVVVPGLTMLNDLYKTVSEPTPTLEEVEYIQAHTDPYDQVLVWGSETGINLLSDRQTPTRFVMQYPLFAPGYSSEDQYQEFSDGVQQALPKLIVDASFGNDRIPALGSSQALYIGTCGDQCTFHNSLEFDSFLQFIASDYEFVKTIESGEYRRDIYRLKASRN